MLHIDGRKTRNKAFTRASRDLSVPFSRPSDVAARPHLDSCTHWPSLGARMQVRSQTEHAVANGRYTRVDFVQRYDMLFSRHITDLCRLQYREHCFHPWRPEGAAGSKVIGQMPATTILPRELNFVQMRASHAAKWRCSLETVSGACGMTCPWRASLNGFSTRSRDAM